MDERQIKEDKFRPWTACLVICNTSWQSPCRALLIIFNSNNTFNVLIDPQGKVIGEKLRGGPEL